MLPEGLVTTNVPMPKVFKYACNADIVEILNAKLIILVFASMELMICATNANVPEAGILVSVKV